MDNEKSNVLKELPELIDYCREHQIIEEPYLDIVRSSFESLMNVVTEKQLEQLFITFKTTAIQLVETESAVKAASMFMGRVSSSPDITLAHINLLMTIISTTFKRGNEILLYVTKYNSSISDMCRRQISLLGELSPIRKAKNKTTDVKYVSKIIDSQFILL